MEYLDYIETILDRKDILSSNFNQKFCSDWTHIYKFKPLAVAFPRNTEQAGLLDQLMHELNFKLNAVIMLDVDKELLLNRIDPSPTRKRSLSFKLKLLLSLDFLKVKSIIS